MATNNNIDGELRQILNGFYGSDIRMAIHDALLKLWNVAKEGGGDTPSPTPTPVPAEDPLYTILSLIGESAYPIEEIVRGKLMSLPDPDTITREKYTPITLSFAPDMWEYGLWLNYYKFSGSATFTKLTYTDIDAYQLLTDGNAPIDWAENYERFFTYDSENDTYTPRSSASDTYVKNTYYQGYPTYHADAVNGFFFTKTMVAPTSKSKFKYTLVYSDQEITHGYGYTGVSKYYDNAEPNHVEYLMRAKGIYQGRGLTGPFIITSGITNPTGTTSHTSNGAAGNFVAMPVIDGQQWYGVTTPFWMDGDYRYSYSETAARDWPPLSTEMPSNDCSTWPKDVVRSILTEIGALPEYELVESASPPEDWEEHFERYYVYDSGDYVQLTAATTYEPGVYYTTVSN